MAQQDSTEREDSLVADLRSMRDAPFWKRLFHGMTLPFRAAKFLMGQRNLWPFVLAPAVINILLFGGALYLLLPRIGLIIEWLQAQMDFNLGLEWLRVGLKYLLTAILGILSVVAAYIFVLLFGDVAASPFNDLLSERTERVLLKSDDIERRDESSIWGILRGIWASLFLLVSYLFLMTLVLLLNLIPGIGPPIATLLGTGLSALFLAVEYSDAPIDRRGGGLRRKFEIIESHRTLSIGFGLGASLMLWIPFLNFLTIPVAVVGGTCLGIVLSDWDREEKRRLRRASE